MFVLEHRAKQVPQIILLYCLTVFDNLNLNSRNFFKATLFSYERRVEAGYNDIGLHDTSSITSDILWNQLRVTYHC